MYTTFWMGDLHNQTLVYTVTSNTTFQKSRAAQILISLINKFWTSVIQCQRILPNLIKRKHPSSP